MVLVWSSRKKLAGVVLGQYCTPVEAWRWGKCKGRHFGGVEWNGEVQRWSLPRVRCCWEVRGDDGAVGHGLECFGMEELEDWTLSSLCAIMGTRVGEVVKKRARWRWRGLGDDNQKADEQRCHCCCE